MNTRYLTWLASAVLAVVIGGVWLGLARKPSTEPSAALYPALKGQLAKVQAVQIYGAGNRLAVELHRTSGGWSLKQRNDYAADTGKINALLLSLEGAKIREGKTNKPENYAALGVQDLTAVDAAGARVELVGIDPPVNLLIGKPENASRGSYVRRAGEAPSWQVSEPFAVGTDPASWLHRDLANIGADRIQEASVQVGASQRYSAVKAQRGDVNFDVTPLPKKRELNSVGAANSIAQALVGLQLDDVRPLAEIASNKSAAQTTFRTFDGLVLELTGYSVDDKQWVTIKAGFDAALAKRFHLPATAPDKTAANAGDSLETDNARVRLEAETLNKRLESWAFAIAPYKFDAIFKPVDQMLRKP